MPKGMGKGGAGILTKAKDAALPGIKTMLGGLGLAAAFFGLKAFLDSEMFQDLKRTADSKRTEHRELFFSDETSFLFFNEKTDGTS